MNGSPENHTVVATDHEEQQADVVIENIPTEKVTIADIKPGTFFIHCGTVYLKIHHNRDHCDADHTTDYPCLDICIPNFDYDATRKVTSACVAMDGTGEYFADVMEVEAVPLKVELRVSTANYKGADNYGG